MSVLATPKRSARALRSVTWRCRDIVHAGNLLEMAPGIEGRGHAAVVAAVDVQGLGEPDHAGIGCGQNFEIEPPVAGEFPFREVGPQAVEGGGTGQRFGPIGPRWPFMVVLPVGINALVRASPPPLPR